jgi:hypothetical protein
MEWVEWHKVGEIQLENWKDNEDIANSRIRIGAAESILWAEMTFRRTIDSGKLPDNKLLQKIIGNLRRPRDWVAGTSTVIKWFEEAMKYYEEGSEEYQSTVNAGYDDLLDLVSGEVLPAINDAHYQSNPREPIQGEMAEVFDHTGNEYRYGRIEMMARIGNDEDQWTLYGLRPYFVDQNADNTWVPTEAALFWFIPYDGPVVENYDEQMRNKRLDAIKEEAPRDPATGRLVWSTTSNDDMKHRSMLMSLQQTMAEYEEKRNDGRYPFITAAVPIKLRNIQRQAGEFGFDDIVTYIDELLQDVGSPVDKRPERHKDILDKWPVISNILDPIHDELDQRVFDGIMPRMNFFNDHLNHMREVFRQSGFNHYAFDFYLTGSICTYQYSDTSDCDITVVCTLDEFADEDRADLVQLVTMSLDGRKFPGTPYPYQHFVQPAGVDIHDLFPIGLRSAFDFKEGRWISPPDKSRVVDIQGQYPDWFHEAIQWSDKMNALIDAGHYEDAYGVYKQIHQRRKEDMATAKNDINTGNVIYKYVVNNGTIDRLRAQGYHIAT